MLRQLRGLLLSDGEFQHVSSQQPFIGGPLSELITKCRGLAVVSWGRGLDNAVCVCEGVGVVVIWHSCHNELWLRRL